MRMIDWSSDVCSSDLGKVQKRTVLRRSDFIDIEFMPVQRDGGETDISQKADRDGRNRRADGTEFRNFEIQCIRKRSGTNSGIPEHSGRSIKYNKRSEEHTTALQSLMRISYAVFCLKQTKK